MARAIRLVAVGAALAALLTPTSAVLAKEAATWEQWQHVAGIFDAYSTPGGVFLATTDGRVSQFDPQAAVFRMLPSFPQPVLKPNDESYIAVSSGFEDSEAGCPFVAGDLWAIHSSGPTQVDELGGAQIKVAIGGVESLNGIVFDTSGAFGHRLLVTGPKKGKTVVVALDCRGGQKVITSAAPTVEGGLAVAPPGFGAYGGALIAPDELSGNVWAVSPDGVATLLLDTSTGLVSEIPGSNVSLPKGQDVGAESVGFVPEGFVSGGGYAYLADRGTPNNPHPGTDSLLRLSSQELSSAIVADGDLLVATEGGAFTADIRCQASHCTGRVVAQGPSVAHPEGHIAFASNRPAASPITSPPAQTLPGEGTRDTGFNWWLLAIPLIVVAAGLLGIALVRSRRST